MRATEANGRRTRQWPEIKMKYNEGDSSFDVYVEPSESVRSTKVPRTEEEFERFFPAEILKRPEPEPFSQKTLDLYRKAIENPDQLQEEDIQDLQDWVPESVADERCLKACGVTWQELVKTAVVRAPDLTHDEIAFLDTGRDILDNHFDRFQRDINRLKQPGDLGQLWMNAREATVDSEYAMAKANAKREGQRIDEERKEGLSHLSLEDQLCNRQALQIPWLAQLAARTDPQWGLVCLRTDYSDEVAWMKFKEHLSKSAKIGLWDCPGSEFVGKMWRLHFIDDDKERLDRASLEKLRRYAYRILRARAPIADQFRYMSTPPSDSSVPSALSSGLRHDSFLFADADAISSLHHPPSDPYLDKNYTSDGVPVSTSHLIAGYVNAVDTFHDPSKTYVDGFMGVLKVHPAHVATTFLQRHCPTGQERGNDDWWQYKQSMETMFSRAKGHGKRTNDVYHPTAVYNH
ncbi:uncharacterized protein KY384_007316 [Bacidia gigantensis]|uniref:uncharacterized protein n=1 Tax=Bacidia gigantensis TaxID=2732470 RepID=UPI001D045506|nr:uncharacterized protein KY384_007316 [Bacidia gigantensis]KAG8528398.1 hypothetical protein KY384_007316 [Bacidia gigantensis]